MPTGSSGNHRPPLPSPCVTGPVAHLCQVAVREKIAGKIDRFQVERGHARRTPAPVMPPLPNQRPRAPYRQLSHTLARFIAEGTLRPGEKLPSVRQMALQHGVSAGTVVKAYAWLETTGQVDAR